MTHKHRRQRTSKMRLNFMANSFVFGRKNRGIAPRTFSQSLQGENFQNTSKFHRKKLRFWTHKSWHSAHKQTLNADNFQNASVFHNKQLCFWTHKSWNCAFNVFCKTRRQKPSKMRLNFTENSFIFGRRNRGIAPRTSVKLACRRLPKYVWIPRQTALWMQKSWNCAQNLFCKTHRQRTSKMRLNSMANNFVFGRRNRGIAPRTYSAKLACREHLKCVWTPRPTTSLLDSKIVELRPERFP